MSVARFIVRQPDDWHLHFRDGQMLAAVIGHSSVNFSRAIIMPNLVPPVATTEQVAAYREPIRPRIPAAHQFATL